ncbi:MAG: ABC transporter permease [Reyranellaceae bacterium]
MSVPTQSGGESRLRPRLRTARLAWLTRDATTAAATAFLVLVALVAVFGPLLLPFDPNQTDLRLRMAPPHWPHVLGTDEQGRDILSRVVLGTRMTMGMGLASLALGGGGGVALGILAAYYRRLDGIAMRAMDLLLSFPAILLGLVIVSLTGPGPGGIVAALAIATMPPVARIARSTAVVVVRQDYVTAARVVGLPDTAILLRYVARNCISSITVYLTLRLGQVVLLAAALSFLGLGAQPPAAELGTMASQGRSFLFLAPHVSLVPSLTIFLIVLAINIVGDALRDRLDPRMAV